MTAAMRCFVRSVLLLAAIGLGACAVEYRPAPFPGAGGYSSKEIRPYVFQVSYLSARTASASTLESFALYRCAEMALEKGFDRFVVLDRRQQSSSALNNSWAWVMYTVEMLGSQNPEARGKWSSHHHARDLLDLLQSRVKPELKS